MTNIREQDAAACNPEIKEALTELQDELAEDATECAQVKQELLDAKTTEAVETATAKARLRKYISAIQSNLNVATRVRSGCRKNQVIIDRTRIAERIETPNQILETH